MDEISDEDVVKSCLDEVEKEDGSLRQYLLHGSVAAIFGNTLFVHGALDRLNIGYVPLPRTRFEVHLLDL